MTINFETNPKFKAGASKWPTSSIPPEAIRELGHVMALGAEKYGAFNWRKTGVDAETYFDAAHRHLLEWWDGRDKDPESLAHVCAHVMACMAIIIDAQSLDMLEDNRPTPGALR